MNDANQFVIGAKTGRNVCLKQRLFASITLLFVASCTPNEEPPPTTAVAPARSEQAPPVKAKQRPNQAVATKAEASPKVLSAALKGPVAAVAKDEKLGNAENSEKPEKVGKEEKRGEITEIVEGIAGELVARCPVADPGDQAAFDACKQAMFGTSKLRGRLAQFTLWGRQHKEPDKTLKETNSTQFGRDVLTGMYLPLFMFSGKSAVTYSAVEKLYRVELGVQFRNRLQPGQFPYPFWHEDEKWKTYENANAILLWFDPKSLTVRQAQFTARGALEPQNPKLAAVLPAFEGKWMWTDAAGQQQPKVTLFDGLFRAENPHLQKVDTSYRQLALSLREGQCMACHVPNNPNKMKKLVLLQTPAHAAAEIKRVMQTVRQGRMPLDDTTGLEHPMAGTEKADLLERAAAFEKVIDAAKAWEAAATAQTIAPKDNRKTTSRNSRASLSVGP
jgi:mono/diheme cytochrome c family protein